MVGCRGDVGGKAPPLGDGLKLGKRGGKKS